MYDINKFLVFLYAKRKNIPLNKNSSLKASKNNGILQVRNVNKSIVIVFENIIALVNAVIIRIMKPRKRLDFKFLLVNPKSLILYFLNFMIRNPGREKRISFIKK